MLVLGISVKEAITMQEIILDILSPLRYDKQQCEKMEAKAVKKRRENTEAKNLMAHKTGPRHVCKQKASAVAPILV